MTDIIKTFDGISISSDYLENKTESYAVSSNNRYAYFETSGKNVYWKPPTNFYLRGRLSKTLNSSGLTKVASPLGVEDCVLISHNQAAWVDSSNSTVNVSAPTDIPSNGVLLFFVNNGNVIGGMGYEMATPYSYSRSNIELGSYLYDGDRGNSYFETSGTSVYVRLNALWIRGKVNVSVSNWDNLSLDKVTSPSGVEGCVKIDQGHALIYNSVLNAYRVADVNSCTDSDIVIFHCVEGRIQGGIGFPLYAAYLADRPFTRSNVTLATDDNEIYFESAGNDLYIKFLDRIFIRGAVNITTPFTSIGLDFVDSPSGVQDCLFVPHRYALTYDRVLSKYYIKELMPDTLTRNEVVLFHVFSGQVKGGIGEQLYRRIVGQNGQSGIVQLNADVRDKLLQANRRMNVGMNTQASLPPIFSILHFSDIHGDGTRLARMQTFKNKYATQLTDTICTGDMVTSRFSDGMAFWSNCDGSVLTCIGNHDALAAATGYDWEDMESQQTLYNTFISPYMANWGSGLTVQTGKTYYYKDYPDNKIRLVVLNCMLLGEEMQEQTTWFENVLSSTPSDYSVVGATHYPPAQRVKLDTTFTSLINNGGSAKVDAFMAAVDTFINNGGKFVCWLAGHTHFDLVEYDSRYPNQLWIVVINAKYENVWGDTQRTEGTKSEDGFNVVSVDTAKKYVKVIRVGADRDCYLRSKQTLTLDYSTSPATVIYND